MSISFLLADIIMHRALQSLNVSDNQLCGHWEMPDFSGFKALISAIEKHKLLKLDTVNMAEALDVSGQQIGAAGAKKMASFVKGNRALTILNLAGNKLGVEGADRLLDLFGAPLEIPRQLEVVLRVVPCIRLCNAISTSRVPRRARGDAH